MIKTGLLWSGLIYLIMLAATVFAWMQTPDDALLPVHWNVHGEADRFASKPEALLGMPAITLLVIILLAIIPAFDPRKENLYKSRAFYLSAWIGVVAVVALAQGMIIYGAVAGKNPPVEIILAGVALMVIVVGNFMSKSRSNWFAGLRTPWTLSSEHAWIVGNRTAGWGFVLTGVLTLIPLMSGSIINAVIVLTAGLFASTIVGTIASYAAWRNDPERIG